MRRATGRSVLLPPRSQPFAHSFANELASTLTKAASQVQKEKLANQIYYGAAAKAGTFYGYPTGSEYWNWAAFSGTPGGAFTPGLEWFQYTYPVWVVGPEVPGQKVWLVENAGENEEIREPGASHNMQSYFTAVPLPVLGSIPRKQIQTTGTDANVIVWRPSSNEMWEMWGFGYFAKGPHAGEPKFAYGGGYFGGYVASAYPELASVAAALGNYPNGWGVLASGIAAAASLLTHSDIVKALKGEGIKHALMMTAPVVKGPNHGAFLAPATRNDSSPNTVSEFTYESTKKKNPAYYEGGTVDAIEEGLYLRLPGASRASEHGISAASEPVATAIYEALREYGLIVVASGGSHCAIYTEDILTLGSPYCSTYINPYANAESSGETQSKIESLITPYAGSMSTIPQRLKEEYTGANNVLSKIPWRELEQLEPRSS